ncbi:glycosyltransferase family 4 protein [Paenibacillus sp. GD4]|uniref:glycosyltransferase family 4 protein n=1 Tax=Paenibacillus sp. GD4 TaxID=3068890 RepID=UPI002796D6AA|nr:glycosyltransferase family 4 protein [Paenibacillus sp. GD4]MDQ1910390.1 glycosyltransferase family 4 protein [Paenibacillus sp. GD4]
MKVAFYNHTSTVSGAEISLLLTARNMMKAEPVIFAPEGELLQRARESGVQAVAIPSYRARLSKNPFKLLLHMLGMLWAGLQLAVILRKHKVELIHANSLRAGIMAALFVWLHRCPLVWHVRDIPPSGLIGKAINRLASLTVTAIIGISQPVLNGFDRSRLHGRMFLVHNGVELQELTEMERRRNRRQLREEFQTPMKSKVMIIVGQITPWKRQSDAVLAAKQLLEQGQDVYLWVVGEAKFRKENTDYYLGLRRLAADLGIEERVRFTGFRQDVTEICCAADLLLLCSDNEPFGRVIIEAMAQSVPVVATDAGGVPEIIDHEYCGLLYEVGDIDGLARCAGQLLQSHELRQRLGGLAKERAKERFTIQSTVAKVESVYQAITAPAGRYPLPLERKGKEIS